MKPCFFLLLVFVLAAYSADAIAVSSLQAAGISPEEAESLTNALRSAIGKSGVYDVMERSQMEEILKEQGFRQTGACDEASCAVELGKVLSVKFMVLGSVGMVGQTYMLSARIVDVTTGKIINDITENHKGPSDALLTDIIPIVSQKLTGTFVKKKPHVRIWIAAGTAVAVAVAVPLIIVSQKEDEQRETSDITVRWNQ